jgi:hypothetical protein
MRPPQADLRLSLPPEAFEVIAQRAAEIVLESMGSKESCEGWPEWLDVKTAARYLSCEVGAVRKLYERRKVPHYQEGPGCKVYLRRCELDSYLVANRKGRST